MHSADTRHLKAFLRRRERGLTAAAELCQRGLRALRRDGEREREREGPNAAQEGSILLCKWLSPCQPTCLSLPRAAGSDQNDSGTAERMQEPEIGNFFFGRNHPLKPHRVRLTHELLQAFSLERKLTTLPASRLTTSEMSKYHADEYAPLALVLFRAWQTQRVLVLSTGRDWLV